MRKYKNKTGLNRNEAVSDMMGVILMVSLVVIGIGGVSVLVTTQSTPDKIPSVDLIPDVYGNDLILYHSGGDSLARDEFIVRVDGVDYYPKDLSIITQGDDIEEDDWDYWKVGESLDIPDESDYGMVQIISTGGSGGNLIAVSGDPTNAPTGTATATPTVTPTETPTATPTPGQPPVAAFMADMTSGTAPLTVNFTDLSTGDPTTWLWVFGDGTTSTEENPEHIYTAAGYYNVSLTVTNAGGSDSENKTSYITVTGDTTPAAWWKFDEDSGSTAIDSSGNGNDGTIEGSYSRVAGACGDGLYFDGVTTYISVPDSVTLDTSDKVTLCAWIYPELPINKSGNTGEYRNYVSIIDKGNNEADNYEFFMQKTEAVSRLTFESDDRLDHLSGVPYEYNRWQHLACVVDTITGTGTVYIDGASVGTFDSPSSLVLNDEPVYIGMQKISGSYPDWATFNFKGKLDEVMLYTTALTAGQVQEIYSICTPPPAPVADFTVDITSGDAPLTVTFSDLSTNAPDTWLWNFGDGDTSTEKNPIHIYEEAGTYSVILTAGNAGGYNTLTKTDYIDVSGAEISDFARFVVGENVFVYGKEFEFEGHSVDGPDATIIITESELTKHKLNGGAPISATEIYIGSSVDLGGSQIIGSQTDPGMIYIDGGLELTGSSGIYGNTVYATGDVSITGSGFINGDLYTYGNVNLQNGIIYGELHTEGDLSLKSARIHDNVYVDGDLTLDWTPSIDDGVYIYYTGSISSPKNYHQSILDKCMHVDSVPEFTIPEYEVIPIPPLKSDEWYASRGYVSGGDLVNNIKIFADSYSSGKWLRTAENVIVVAKTGDITLTGLGGSMVSGLLYAPNGEVKFNGGGGSFEGVVITKDGCYFKNGGGHLTFRNIENYFDSPEDYPF